MSFCFPNEIANALLSVCLLILYIILAIIVMRNRRIAIINSFFKEKSHYEKVFN